MKKSLAAALAAVLIGAGGSLSIVGAAPADGPVGAFNNQSHGLTGVLNDPNHFHQLA